MTSTLGSASAPDTLSPASARALLLESAEFGPNEIRSLEKLLSGGRTSEVRQTLGELESRLAASSAPRDLIAAGVTAHFLGLHQRAANYLSQAASDPLAAYYHAQALVALERPTEALDRYDEAERGGFDRIQCQLRRSGALRMLGQLDEAEKLLQSTGREGATRAEYSYQMGTILSDRGDTYGALEYFERAHDMDPHHTGALFRLAGEHNTFGDDAKAIQLYEKALSKPPLYLGALINLGLLYEDRENYGAAAFCFRRVLDVYPNHERARLYLKDIEAVRDMYYDEDALRRQRDLEQVMNVPLIDFELSARARNCLERANLNTLGDLTRITEQELLGERNFGESSLKEISAILESRGLRFGQSLATSPLSAPRFVLPDDLSPQERAQAERPVADLNLSVRARKCLSRLSISTIGDLVARTPDELMGVRNFGVTSLNEIRAKLTEMGMKLRND